MLICSGLYLPASAAAEEGKGDGHIGMLNEVVVTGTRTEKMQSESPVKVEVVDEKTITRRHARDLAEAISSVPGINIREIHGKEGSEAWIQGISANRVLVLVDGEPVSASTGSSVDLTQVSVASVKQVEIVKGATSVLYGSAAMGGVINVITAEPEKGFHTQLAVDGGSYGEQNTDGRSDSIAEGRVQGRLGYAGEAFMLAAGVNARLSDGFQVDPDAWSQQGPDGHKINAYAMATIKPDSGSKYGIRYEQYEQEQHNRITALLPPPNNRKHKQDDAERRHLAVNGGWQLDNDEIKVNAYNEVYENVSSPDGSFDRIAEFVTDKASVQWNNDKLEKQLWTFGGEIFRESMTQEKILDDGTVSNEVNGCDSIERERTELYVQDDVALPWLNLVPGLRVQHDSDFGVEWTPKINLRHDLFSNGQQQLFIRGGVGAGYRTPNLKERCYVFDHSHLGYMVIGNEDLEAEKSTSYQLGISYQSNDRYLIEFNLFRNDLKELIEVVYSHHEGNISISQYQNIEKAYTKGVELDVSYRISSSWHIKGGYTWMEAIDEILHERLKDRPENQVKLVVAYASDYGTDMSLLSSWQDDEYSAAENATSPAWQQYDFRINQQLHRFWSVYGGINNITNKQRKFDGSYDNRPVEGRLVYAGFRFDY